MSADRKTHVDNVYASASSYPLSPVVTFLIAVLILGFVAGSMYIVLVRYGLIAQSLESGNGAAAVALAMPELSSIWRRS
jgi:hypothetical protein